GGSRRGCLRRFRGRLIQVGEVKEQDFEAAVVLVLLHLGLRVAQAGDLALDFIAARADLGSQREFGGAAEEMQLVRTQSIQGRIVAGAFGGAESTEPVGRGAES